MQQRDVAVAADEEPQVDDGRVVERAVAVAGFAADSARHSVVARQGLVRMQVPF